MASGARPSTHGYCRAADADHQHAALSADRLVVDIDADDRVGTALRRFLLHLRERNFPRPLEFFLVGCRAPANDVPNAGEEILEYVGAQDCLAGYYAVVAMNRFTFDAGSG